MYEKIPPRIDQWYLDEGNDLAFTVIDFDSVEGIIEIQYVDGEIAELNLEDWEELSLEEIEPDDFPWPTDELTPADPDYDEAE